MSMRTVARSQRCWQALQRSPGRWTRSRPIDGAAAGTRTSARRGRSPAMFARRPRAHTLTAAAAAAAAAAAVGIGGWSFFGIGRPTTLLETAATPPDRLAGWQQRWESQTTRWHLSQANPVLMKYLPQLLPAREEEHTRAPSILFPLCGASRDLGTLALEGYQVVGVEGVGLAINKLFEGFGEESPVSRRLPGLTLREAKTAAAKGGVASIQAVQGDFFQLSVENAGLLGIGPFDAAFDRGSLVAISPDDRPQYSETLSELIASGGRILLVTVEHGPFANGKLGPPFSIEEPEIRRLFPSFEVQLLHREDTTDDFRDRGVESSYEVAYLLIKRADAGAVAPPEADAPGSDARGAPSDTEPDVLKAERR